MFWHDPQAQIRGGVVFDSPQRLADAIRAGRCPQLSIVRGGDVEELAALAVAVRDVTLVVDELDRACNDKKWISESVKKIVHEGRHLRVDLFGSFRSTRNVSEDLIAQADVVFLFQQNGIAEHDLNTIRRRFGDSYADDVQQFEKGEFTVWRD